MFMEFNFTKWKFLKSRQISEFSIKKANIQKCLGLPERAPETVASGMFRLRALSSDFWQHGILLGERTALLRKGYTFI
jgi:hypothetical protein